MSRRSLHDPSTTSVRLAARIEPELWAQWRVLCMRKGRKSAELLTEVISRYVKEEAKNDGEHTA